MTQTLDSTIPKTSKYWLAKNSLGKLFVSHKGVLSEWLADVIKSGNASEIYYANLYDLTSDKKVIRQVSNLITAAGVDLKELLAMLNAMAGQNNFTDVVLDELMSLKSVINLRTRFNFSWDELATITASVDLSFWERELKKIYDLKASKGEEVSVSDLIAKLYDSLRN